MTRKHHFLFSIFLTGCLFCLLSFTNRPAIVTYSTDAIVFNDTTPPKDTELKVFETVEQEAYFPGGLDGWRQYLEQNLNPDVPVNNGAPEGFYTVMVQFIVNKDGTLSDMKALTHHGYGMEAEVLRIIKKSPPWVPAIQHKRNVKAYRKQPVTFHVIDERKKKRKHAHG